jgi:SAM-dependent methyltransferase
MTVNESAVASHYGDADLLTRIMGGLKAAGIDERHLRADDLAPVDEFHIGGREATAYAVSKLCLRPDHRLLDVGCGIGGAARYIATQIGCKVAGIDLTPEYISAARALTDMTGLADKVTFDVASALDMPFDSETFDAAITIHVAMNIVKRAELYREIARVLRPGAAFCAYDVMRKSDEDLVFPVPWAQSAETSHLTTPDETHALLGDAGFEVDEVEDRTDVAIEFFQQRLASAGEGPPPLGVHLVIGASAPEKFKNTLDNVQSGRIAPVQIMARRK